MSQPNSFQLSPIKLIEMAAAKIPGAISLAQGIPSFPAPQVVRDFVIEKISQGLCDKYSLTMGLTELREEISSSLLKDGLSYDADSEIIVTAGSIEGITASILALTSPGQEVLIPSPSYASYQGSVKLAKCTPKFFRLDEERNFDFNIESLEREITKNTKLILYCSPNNPTGTLFSEEKTRAIVRLAEKHDLKILIDEVYKDFYYSDDRHFTACAIPEARDRIVRACSFSKAYAMTGWRVGFVHGPSKLMTEILKFHDAMVTCAPVVSQYGAIAALRFCDSFLLEFRNEFRKRRDFVIEALDSLSLYLDYQLPRATYFVFPRIKDSVPLARDSTKLAYDILEKSKVALVPGIAFGPSGESHLRINFGRDWDDIRGGLNRLQEYFGSKNVLPSLNKDRALNTIPKRESFASLLARPILKLAAKVFIFRKRPLIIGILGARGKTVFKREIMEALASRLKVRGTILSYNTEIGLPLSILGLELPKSLIERSTFLFRVLWASLFWNDSAKALILEYGILSKDDGKNLASIAIPDWLVITPLSNDDMNISSAGLISGTREVASLVRIERRVWCRDDPGLAALEVELRDELAISKAEGDYVSQSFKLARNAGVRLREAITKEEPAI